MISNPAKDAFRRQFQNALRQCVRRGFSLEESFGLIWNETLEEIPLQQFEETELYREMIQWAKLFFAADQHARANWMQVRSAVLEAEMGGWPDGSKRLEKACTP